MSKDIRSVEQEIWLPLEPYALPTTVGRRLDVGGFVFGDSFETFLRNISEEYLHAAWIGLSKFIDEHGLPSNDLTWGWMHGGETGLPRPPGLPEETYDLSMSYSAWPGYGHGVMISPVDYIGWTSCNLSDLWSTSDDCKALDDLLKVGKPSLRCTVTWRSLKWNIAPENYEIALKLIEAICFDVAEWHPNTVLSGIEKPIELWRQTALAIREDNQQRLNECALEAKRVYTPLGFRIFARGYRGYFESGNHEGKTTLPEILEW